ncbi:unnamed protein product, partial [Ectocarpus sp. 4 AP-2014]
TGSSNFSAPAPSADCAQSGRLVQQCSTIAEISALYSDQNTSPRPPRYVPTFQLFRSLASPTWRRGHPGRESAGPVPSCMYNIMPCVEIWEAAFPALRRVGEPAMIPDEVASRDVTLIISTAVSFLPLGIQLCGRPSEASTNVSELFHSSCHHPRGQ